LFSWAKYRVPPDFPEFYLDPEADESDYDVIDNLKTAILTHLLLEQLCQSHVLKT